MQAQAPYHNAAIEQVVLIQRVNEAANKFRAEIVAKPGGGGENVSMETRIAKLEVVTEHIRSDLSEIKSDIREIKKDAREDFRILAGMIIALGLGMAGLMSKGFHWI